MPKVQCTSKDCRWVLKSGWCTCPEIEIIEKTIYIPRVGENRYHVCNQYKRMIDPVAFMEERGLD